MQKTRPTITVCQLEDGEYQTCLYRDDNVVELKTFPALKLTANQIFQSAEVDYELNNQQ